MSGPRVLFFGRLREAAGGPALAAPPPEHVRTIPALRAWITTQNPPLARAIAARGVRVVLNGTFLTDEAGAFAAQDEIAFLPPLSGG